MAKSARKKPTNVLSMPKPASTSPEQKPSANPTDAAIATRAFELYCERGCQNGRDVEDWLQAERELRETASSTAA
jgi:hypothetical protein